MDNNVVPNLLPSVPVFSRASESKLPMTWVLENTLQNYPLKFPRTVPSGKLHLDAWLLATKVR